MRSRIQRQRTAGFTLIEAMVVVAIISISAAVAAPALSEAMAVRRANESTHALVRLGAQAQAASVAFSRAHVIRYEPASTGGSNGRAQLWRGRVDRCTSNPWGAILVGTCASTPNCVDELDMARYDFGTHSVRMRMPGVAQGLICFQPDGETYFSTGPAAPFTQVAPAGTSPDGFRFTFERLQGGASVDVVRAVVFPFGGTPRIER